LIQPSGLMVLSNLMRPSNLMAPPSLVQPSNCSHQIAAIKFDSTTSGWGEAAVVVDVIATLSSALSSQPGLARHHQVRRHCRNAFRHLPLWQRGCSFAGFERQQTMVTEGGQSPRQSDSVASSGSYKRRAMSHKSNAVASDRNATSAAFPHRIAAKLQKAPSR
jgi:hypothetical protein